MRFLKGGPQLCLAKSWINVDTVPWRQFRRAKRTLAKTGRPLGKEGGLQQLVTTRPRRPRLERSRLNSSNLAIYLQHPFARPGIALRG
jgi:hypothetical protein